MTPQLATVFVELDEFEGVIPRERMRRWLDDCGIGLDDVKHYCRFHPRHYVRNLLRAGPAYHALVLCWHNGQRSPIHDHSGSRCAVKVLSGEATETRFDTAPNGMIYATASSTLCEGTTCYSEDAEIHQLSNLQANEADLVTLHLYSPPLLRMNAYSLHGADAREFFDPINDEFVAGAGI